MWKPSEKTPLTALAVQALFERAVARFRRGRRGVPSALSTVLIGGREVGEALVDDPQRSAGLGDRLDARWAARSAPRLAKRFARAILELGGNNARHRRARRPISTSPLRAVAFAAMGTAGQRCTTLRRLFVHDSVYEALVPRLKRAYASVHDRQSARARARWSAR